MVRSHLLFPSIVLAAGLVAGLATPVLAGYDVNSRIDALEHELRELKAQVAARDQRLVELETRTSDLGDLPKFDSSKLMISSRDGNWSIRFGGRVHLDATIVNDDVSQIGNGAEFRRLRWDVSGKIAGDWDYKVQVGFENNAVRIQDAYIATKIGGVKFMFGNHKEPYSLEELTSSNYITFIERSLPNVFAPSRNLGVSASVGGENWGASAGFFTDGINNGGFGAQTTDWATTGRLHYAPVLGDAQAVHLGVAGTYRGVEDGGTTFNARPEFNDGRGILTTGALANVDKVSQVGPEAAFVFGPLSLQAEYHWATVERTAGLADADLEGGYVFASWFVTGESRPYDVASGAFGRVKTEDGVELAARYSVVDLSDAGAAARTGEEENITLGGNYYFNANVRAMLNFIHADIDRPVGGTDETVEAVVTRLQVDF